MATVIFDQDLSDRLIRERKARGQDRWDEVWEGQYMMAAWPGTEHQRLAGAIYRVCAQVVDDDDLGVSYQGCNVSDRDDWTNNYRIPDVAVFLNGNPAEDRESHFFGGPDFALEILSRNDPARDKLDFHADVGVKEVMILDRDPWTWELYRSSGTPASPKRSLNRIGNAAVGDSALASNVLGLRFSMSNGNDRPVLHLEHPKSSRLWEI